MTRVYFLLINDSPLERLPQLSERRFQFYSAQKKNCLVKFQIFVFVSDSFGPAETREVDESRETVTIDQKLFFRNFD